MERCEKMAPACMKCPQVTGKTTCFPSPCVFFHERNTPGTMAHNVATLDRIRRSGGPVRAATDLTQPRRRQ
jgi:hypothetical protein